MRRTFSGGWNRTPQKTPDYQATSLGLTADEAGFWTSLVWMSGGMALLSEVWNELPPDRQALLADCFQAHGRNVSILNWFEQPDTVAFVAEGEPCLAGVFNFGDTACRPEIPAVRLGLSGHWKLRERWSGEVMDGTGSLVVFPELPPRSGRIWKKIA
jgi:hypothetical protein